MILGVLAGGAGARAQDLPVPRAVVALESDTSCPSVPTTHLPRMVATSEGVARSEGDGTFSWLCPERWGGDKEVEVLSDPTASTVWVLTDAGVWQSEDGGCAGTLLALPGDAVAIDILYWRSALWVLTRPDAEGLARLLRQEGDGFIPVTTWDDFRPDGMAAEDAEHLWLAGGLPSAQVRRLGLGGGLSGDAPIGGLPADATDLESLVPVAAGPGEAWIRATRRGTVWLWHAGTDAAEPPATTVVEAGARGRFQSGPVLLDGTWLLLQGGVVFTAAPGAGVLTDSGATVPWIAVSSLGERVFATTVQELLAVTGWRNNGAPRAVPVFSALQVAGPDPVCGPDAACDATWATIAGLVGNGPEPAVCPDGTTATDLDPASCACGAGPAPGWWLVGVALVARRRRFARPPVACSGSDGA